MTQKQSSVSTSKTADAKTSGQHAGSLPSVGTPIVETMQCAEIHASHVVSPTHASGVFTPVPIGERGSTRAATTAPPPGYVTHSNSNSSSSSSSSSKFGLSYSTDDEKGDSHVSPNPRPFDQTHNDELYQDAIECGFLGGDLDAKPVASGYVSRNPVKRHRAQKRAALKIAQQTPVSVQQPLQPSTPLVVTPTTPTVVASTQTNLSTLNTQNRVFPKLYRVCFVLCLVLIGFVSIVYLCFMYMRRLFPIIIIGAILLMLQIIGYLRSRIVVLRPNTIPMAFSRHAGKRKILMGSYRIVTTGVFGTNVSALRADIGVVTALVSHRVGLENTQTLRNTLIDATRRYHDELEQTSEEYLESFTNAPIIATYAMMAELDNLQQLELIIANYDHFLVGLGVSCVVSALSFILWYLAGIYRRDDFRTVEMLYNKSNWSSRMPLNTIYHQRLSLFRYQPHVTDEQVMKAVETTYLSEVEAFSSLTTLRDFYRGVANLDHLSAIYNLANDLCPVLNVLTIYRWFSRCQCPLSAQVITSENWMLWWVEYLVIRLKLTIQQWYQHATLWLQNCQNMLATPVVHVVGYIRMLLTRINNVIEIGTHWTASHVPYNVYTMRPVNYTGIVMVEQHTIVSLSLKWSLILVRQCLALGSHLIIVLFKEFPMIPTSTLDHISMLCQNMSVVFGTLGIAFVMLRNYLLSKRLLISKTFLVIMWVMFLVLTVLSIIYSWIHYTIGESIKLQYTQWLK